VKNILITGGAGFVGTNLCEYLFKLGNEVTSLDNYTTGKTANHIDGVKYYNGDTRDIDRIFSNKKFDCIFHLGEYSKIEPSFNNFRKVCSYNMLGTASVIDYCIKNKIKIVYAASSTRFAEEGITHSPYSFTKSQNVDLIKSCAEWFDLNYSVCYFYNNYGPYHDTSDNEYKTVISVFQNQKLSGQKLTITKPGTQRRNYTHVHDTVRGLYKSYLYENNGEFQLCNENEYSLFELAKLFKSEFILTSEREGDRLLGANDLVLDYLNETKAKLNWEAKISLEDWIKSMEICK